MAIAHKDDHKYSIRANGILSFAQMAIKESLSAYYQSLILTKGPMGKYHYPYFSNEEMDAYKYWVYYTQGNLGSSDTAGCQ